jgi:MFS family permease
MDEDRSREGGEFAALPSAGAIRVATPVQVRRPALSDDGGHGASERRQFLSFLGTSFGDGVFNSFNNFTLTLWLSNFTSSYLLLSLLGNSRSFEGVLVGPTVGAWSDRTWLGWLGRRRPFILAGGLLTAGLMAVTPAASRLALPSGMHLGGAHAGLIPAAVMIFLFTLTNGAMDVHKALIADIAVPRRRNLLSALSVVVGMCGQVAILVVGFLLWSDRVPDWAFLVTAAVLIAGALITVLGVREPAPEVWRAERVAALGTDVARVTFAEIGRQYRPAAFLCLVAFCFWTGVNGVMPLISVYTRDILGASVGEAQALPALLLLMTLLCALPAAHLGNRIGKRATLAAGYVLLALCGLAALVISTKEQGALVFLLAGVGNAAGQVLPVPLLADLVPKRHMGVATGALAASGSVAAPLASLAGGALSDAFGPRAIFGLMVAMIALALVLLIQVQAPRDPDERVHQRV